MHEQPGGEIHKVQEGLEVRSFCSHEDGVSSLQHWDVFTNSKALRTPYFRDFYGSLITSGQLLTQSPASPLSPKNEGGGWA